MKIINREIFSFNEDFKKIHDNEIVVEKGTELFHGTVEEFDIRNITTGGYDNILWTAPEPAIAQTYIPTSGSMIYTSSSNLANPSDEYYRKTEKQLGIDYDYSQVKFEGNRVTSHPPAPVFAKFYDEYYSTLRLFTQKHRELDDMIADLTKKINDRTISKEEINQKEEEIDLLQDEVEILKEKYYNSNLDKRKNEYVNNKLIELGYKPYSMDTYNLNHSWKLKMDDARIMRADEKTMGRLIIIKPKRDLKIYDTTMGGKREGDLTDVDYHKHDWFKKTEEAGYDGIKINDFAQSEDLGNFGHPSYGLFNNTIKDLEFEEVPAQHRELEPIYRSGNYDTPEYDKYKSLVNEEIEALLNEDFNQEIGYLNQHGYKLIDKQEINNYILFLVKEPHEGLYEIAITSNNRSFITQQSQQKIPGTGEGKEFSTARGFKTTISNWLNKYSPIYVGSLNKNKTSKYHTILSRLGFNVGEINYDQPVVVDGSEVFPESWNFVISLRSMDVLKESFKIKSVINEELFELLNETAASDIWERYYNKIPKETFYKIIKADPTSKPERDKMGKFSKWLLNLFFKDKLKFEDLYKATDYLKRFMNLNKYLDKKDILQYRSLPELYAELKKLDVRKHVDVFDGRGNALINDGEANLFYEDNEWVVLIPKTLKASCHFGSEAWCTTKPDYFKDYTDTGDLYIFVNKGNPEKKYQLHLHDGQFMDINDEDANITEIIPESLFKMILEKEGFQYETIDLSKENYEKHMELIDDYYCERRNEIPKQTVMSVLQGDYHADLYEVPFDDWLKEFIYYVRDEVNKSLAERNVDVNATTFNDELISDLDDADFIEYLQEEHDDIYESLISVTRSAAEGTYYDEFYKAIISGIENFDYDNYKHNALKFGLTVDEDSCIEVDEPHYGFDYSPTSATFKEYFQDYYEF